jgi:dolichol-phosphate mannosyltransferase
MPIDISKHERRPYSQGKLVSIVVPTYNEGGNIVPLVGAIHAALRDYEHEILVVDDNSPDGTYNIVADLGYDFLRPILRTENRGFANSIRCGLENAKGSILIVMDSDFNHQPKYLPFMVDALDYYDCVLASRFVYSGSMGHRTRHLLSWTFNIFVRIVTGGMVTDTLYGYFSVRKESLAILDFNKIFWGYGDYCIRLMYYLQRQKAKILQFPAINGKRLKGEGNSNFFKVFFQYFTEVMKLVWRERIIGR